MKLTWLGHACFALEQDGYRVVVDPYRDVEGCADVDTWANAVYKSHDHYDHNYFAGVALREGGENPFRVETVSTWHDAQNGALRGKNTIHIFSFGGLRVAHLGDLGHPLSPEQLSAMGEVDVLLLPIGGTYTLDVPGAKAVAESCKAPVVIPMHYRDGSRDFAVLQTAEEFTALFSPEQVFVLPGNTLELKKGMAPGVYRLSSGV